MLNIENRVKQLSLNLIHGIFNGKGPSYLEPNFVRKSHGHQTRARDNCYNVPHVNSVTSTTFYFIGIKLWNALPDQIKLVSDRHNFKHKVKHHLIDLQRVETSNVYV